MNFSNADNQNESSMDSNSNFDNDQSNILANKNQKKKSLKNDQKDKIKFQMNNQQMVSERQNFQEAETISGIKQGQQEKIGQIQERKKSETSKKRQIQEPEEEGLAKHNLTPLYIIEYGRNGEDDLGIVVGRQIVSIPINQLTQEERQMFIEKYRRGEMLKPLRQLFLNDLEIELVKQALEKSTTDDIINRLRKYYIQGLIELENLTENQQKTFKKFVLIPPQYYLILPKQASSVDIEEFRKNHTIRIENKIKKKIYSYNKEMCDIIIKHPNFGDQTLSLQYFLSQKFEVNTCQKINQTKEVSEVLTQIYQIAKKREPGKINIDSQKNNQNNEIKGKDLINFDNDNKKNDVTTQGMQKTNLENRNNNKTVTPHLVQNTATSTQHIFSSKSSPNTSSFSEDISSNTNESTVTITPKSQQPIQNRSNILDAKEKKSKLIIDQLSYLIKLNPNIKQTYNNKNICNKIDQVLKDFKDMHIKICSWKQQNQQPNNFEIDTFFLKYMKIDKYIQKVINDYRIDMTNFTS